MQREDEERRDAQHDQVLLADRKLPQFDELEIAQRGKFVGAVGKGDGDGFFELHPDGEARNHRGHRRAFLDRPETQAFDIGAGDHRAQDGRHQHGVPAGLELEEQEGPEEHADHDRRAVGQVEAAQDAENQREADGKQGVTRTYGNAVEGVLDEIENPVSPPPVSPRRLLPIPRGLRPRYVCSADPR